MSKTHIFCTEGILINPQMSIPFKQFKEITPWLHQAMNLHPKASQQPRLFTRWHCTTTKSPEEAQWHRLYLWILVARLNPAEHGQDEGSCLASTGLRLRDQVLRAAGTAGTAQRWKHHGALGILAHLPLLCIHGPLTSYAPQGRNCFLPNTPLQRFSVMRIWKNCGYSSVTSHFTRLPQCLSTSHSRSGLQRGTSAPQLLPPTQDF